MSHIQPIYIVPLSIVLSLLITKTGNAYLYWSCITLCSLVIAIRHGEIIWEYGKTLVTTGATTGYDVRTDLRHIFFKGLNVVGSTQGTRSELESGLYWMSQGKIKSVVDSIFSLEDASTAHQKMLSGKDLFGKILMKP